MLQYGWMNRQALDGTYRDHITGQRGEVNIQAYHTQDGLLQKFADAKTAVHMKLMQNNGIGSAGVVLYSGRLDSVQYQGSEGSPFSYSLQYHANVWTAFGSGM